MPCNSDYLRPRPEEEHLQRVAKLLVYVLTKLGRQISEGIKQTADNIYADCDYAPQLCDLLNAMKDDERDALVYNARDKAARDLADWWEEHQDADRARVAREAEEHQREDLMQRATAKLTLDERRALGLE